jgi:hypothetical protein
MSAYGGYGGGSGGGSYGPEAGGNAGGGLSSAEKSRVMQQVGCLPGVSKLPSPWFGVKGGVRAERTRGKLLPRGSTVASCRCWWS